MRGPLRDHLFVRTAAAVATTTGTTASMPFRPATKLTTQMIVMTCFFEEEEKTPPQPERGGRLGEEGEASAVCHRLHSTCYRQHKYTRGNPTSSNIRRAKMTEECHLGVSE